ncbi:putative DNA binding domain-containing protein [Patescibacteria group bacterium]|nr:putative DNA binding domain-containing protein [Patescibacteria group bacterium]
MNTVHSPDWQETENIEFKESLNEKQEAGKDLVAFANKSGGVIYFGVKNNGDIIGLTGVSEKTLRDLAQLYTDNTEPKLYAEIALETIEGKPVIKVGVKKSGTPYHTFKGVSYIRVGSSNRKMDQAEYTKRLVEFQNATFDFSAEICKQLRFEDLDMVALESLQKRWATKEQKKEYLDFSHREVLQKLLLVRGNKFTYAALVLCGKAEKIAEYLPEAEIRFGWRSNANKLDFDFTKDWKAPFLNVFNEIWEVINARNTRFPFEQGFIEGDIWAFDQISIREAVLNAFVHRDYQERGSIFIEANSANFNIKSPGKFLPGVSAQNILDIQGKWRNRLLMETLGKIGLVERYGHGLDRIFRKSIEEGKGTPVIAELPTGFVNLTIPAQVKDKKFIVFLERAAKEKQIIFDFAKDLVFLDEIREHQNSTDMERRNKFMQLDIIEKTGKGRGTKYFLSHKLYNFLGKKAEYTRKKWLSKEEQKVILLKFLRQHKKGRMSEFREGLFESKLSNQQINLLLNELRAEGKVYFEGPQRSQKAFWKIKDTT